MSMDLIALREKIELLEEENRQLKELLEPKFSADPKWGLTGSETRVLGYLVQRQSVTNEFLIDALYMGSAANKIPDDPSNMLKVWICRLRRKLKPFDIEINTEWGVGYFISAEHRAFVLQSCGERK